MAKLNEGYGYGQVELNQVAFRRDGRIIAQYALDGMDYAENGMLLAVDYVNRKIKKPTKADDNTVVALNYTTEHMYDERLAGGLRHFKLDKDTFRPRLGLLTTGDRFTTNTVVYTTDTLQALETAINGGTAYGHVSTDGYITVNTTATSALLKAIEYTTMPDGAPAIKFVVL